MTSEGGIIPRRRIGHHTDITVELAETPTSTLNFQLWDTEGYFNDHASYDMEGMTTLSKFAYHDVGERCIDK